VVTSYLICGTPRTGSTLLCGLLRDTGIAGRPESYFRLQGEQSWADRWHLPHEFDYRDFVGRRSRREALRTASSPPG
jgi:LPS sulfotransferase NodH